MRIIQCEQGTAEWFKARLGIPTASRADQIVTPKGKLSTSARKYAHRLIAERLLNRPTETLDGQFWMERGKELEPQAISQYEFTEEVATKQVGFITTDDGLLGASPDRLVCDRPIGVEVKCCSAHIHIGYLIDGPGDAYKPQVQMQIMVAELERADLYLYHPRTPPALIMTHRDDAYIALLRDALDQFNEMLFEMTQRARSLGIFQAYEDIATPAEAEYAANLAEAEL